MKYRFNGLKSPLWGGLFSPLFSPFDGSSMAGGGDTPLPANAITTDAVDLITTDAADTVTTN